MQNNIIIMCTYNITVNENALSRMRPAFSRESFGMWLQHHVDQLVAEMSGEQASVSPNAHSREEMKAIVEERLHLMESGQATYTDGEEGFAQIRARYGL